MVRGKNIIQRNAQSQIIGFRDYSKFENKNNETCKIENFVLSYQGDCLAIVLARVEKCQYYNLFEYKIDIINIKSDQDIYQGEWLGSYKQHDIFCQFSFCCKYLVDYSNQTLNLRNIQAKKLVRLHNIQHIYMLDQQNQIYLLKENKIQIYSISSNTFKEILIGENGLTQLLTTSTQTFLGVKEIFQMFFLQNLKKKWLYTAKNKFSFTKKDKIYERQNSLLVTYSLCSVQLRNTKKFKLIRNIFLNPQNRQNFIKFKDDYYLCQTISSYSEGILICEQLNLITGKSTQISFKQKINFDEELYITDSNLISINESHKKIRYFSFVDDDVIF